MGKRNSGHRPTRSSNRENRNVQCTVHVCLAQVRTNRRQILEAKSCVDKIQALESMPRLLSDRSICSNGGLSRYKVQGSIEVMKLAWFIGKRVSSGELTLPVDAYFVSSRKAQNDATMTALCHAFEVAMSGVITEEDAREDAAFREGVEISRSALDTLSTC